MINTFLGLNIKLINIKEKKSTPSKEEKKPKTEKTMTGKKATEVKVDPELEENKETGKKGVEQLKKETKLKGKNLQAACPSAEPAAGM